MAIDASLVGKKTDAGRFEFGFRDTALYALGIGAKKGELDYLYEGRGPKVIPTFAVVPKFDPMLKLLADCGGDMSMIVHGGETVEVHRPIAANDVWSTTVAITKVYDLRRFASVVVEAVSCDKTGEPIATTTSSIIFRGAGGFGGEAPPKDGRKFDTKSRAPDHSISQKTTDEQALLYRLSGDYNPLHADPEFAKNVGFEQGPILHGLCTFGFMARHVAQSVCDGDATRIRKIEAQFRKPVWPGDTLVTNVWRAEGNTYALNVAVKERDEIVIAGAWATIA